MSSETSAIIIGGLISLATSLGTSWYVADRYFLRQRELDKIREDQEFRLAFTKLMHAYFEVLRKRPKHSSKIRIAMAEFEARMKIFKPGYDVSETMEEAAEQAQQFIDEHPSEFEDIANN